MSWFAAMGFALFGFGSVLTVVGLGMAALGYATGRWAGWIIASVAAGQATMVGSVAFLADRRDARAIAGEELAPASAGRRRAGLLMLVLHVAIYLFVWLFGVLSYVTTTSNDPLQTVYGLSFEARGPVLVWGVILAEFLFVGAVWLLGPAWRHRFKELFRYVPSSTTATPAASGPPPTLRYRIGLGVFVVGNVLAAAGLVLPAVGLATGSMVGAIAVMLAAGEVLSWTSIAFLGKEGFKELKSKLFRMLRRVPSDQPISRRRHRVGCTLLAAHVIVQFAALVFPITAYFGAVGRGATQEVLGLGPDAQLRWFVGLLAVAEILFFAAVYGLGGDWWGRFRALFSFAPRSR